MNRRSFFKTIATAIVGLKSGRSINPTSITTQFCAGTFVQLFEPGIKEFRKVTAGVYLKKDQAIHISRNGKAYPRKEGETVHGFCDDNFKRGEIARIQVYGQRPVFIRAM